MKPLLVSIECDTDNNENNTVYIAPILCVLGTFSDRL